jgi:sulfite reductase (ferredoxin)
VLETEYLHRTLPDGPAPATSPAHRDHIGVKPQQDGLVAIGGTTRAGRTSGTALRRLADIADKYGKHPGGGRVRLTAQQGVVVLDVEAAQTETVVDEFADAGFTVRPSAFRRGTIACTGIEFCKLALIETKGRAETIRAELESRLPDFDTPITINVNGCPNSCARFQVADIGFKGMVQKGPTGDVEAFQVHLGGQMGTEAEFGRKVRGLKVTAEEAPDYVERVLRGYLERREGGEPFAAYVSRADESWLL